METMYTEALKYHVYSVIGLVVMITAFYLFTQQAKDLIIYKKRIRSFMPVYIVALSASIFTGIIMMSAKHLDFTLVNNLMIALSVFIIFLQIKRHQLLKTISQENLIKLSFIRLMYALELLTIFGVVYLAKTNAA